MMDFLIGLLATIGGLWVIGLVILTAKWSNDRKRIEAMQLDASFLDPGDDANQVMGYVERHENPR